MCGRRVFLIYALSLRLPCSMNKIKKKKKKKLKYLKKKKRRPHKSDRIDIKPFNGDADDLHRFVLNVESNSTSTTRPCPEIWTRSA